MAGRVHEWMHVMEDGSRQGRDNMMITMQNWTIPDDLWRIAFESDKSVTELVVTTDAPEGWQFKLDVSSGEGRPLQKEDVQMFCIDTGSAEGQTEIPAESNADNT
jgi:hypothetical protein